MIASGPCPCLYRLTSACREPARSPSPRTLPTPCQQLLLTFVSTGAAPVVGVACRKMQVDDLRMPIFDLCSSSGVGPEIGLKHDAGGSLQEPSASLSGSTQNDSPYKVGLRDTPKAYVLSDGLIAAAANPLRNIASPADTGPHGMTTNTASGYDIDHNDLPMLLCYPARIRYQETGEMRASLSRIIRFAMQGADLGLPIRTQIAISCWAP